jgi:hypothetical protein
MKDAPKPAAAPEPKTAPRLSGVRGLPHDDDERPSREDADYGQTIFTRGTVSLPPWLKGRKPRE